MKAEEYIEKIHQGDRPSLGRAITLLESARPEKAALGHNILESLPASTKRTLRIGVTGPPGVGKSTFIESYGMHLIGQGAKICALTVDPSSPINRGSILGDKTRMQELAHHPNAFVRSSPSGLAHGGLSIRSHDIIRLCSQLDFDYLFIETVGVGQSEIDVHSVCDVTLLLAQPGSGDDLQGIKKGILEIADLIIVHKCDGNLERECLETSKHLRGSAHLLQKKYDGLWAREIVRVSSLKPSGHEELDRALQKWLETCERCIPEIRNEQSSYWFAKKADELLLNYLKSQETIDAALQQQSGQIKDGETDLYSALRVLQSVLKKYYG